MVVCTAVSGSASRGQTTSAPVPAPVSAQTFRPASCKFVSAAWKNFSGREEMVEDLLANYKLKGMTTNELHDLLGEPSHAESPVKGHLYYSLNVPRDVSHCGGWGTGPWDGVPAHARYNFGSCLDIELSKNRIVSVARTKIWVTSRSVLPEGAPIPDSN